jgi:hypothetical protein
MILQDLMDYFKQIKLLKVIKQASETIVVDDNNEKWKKYSSQCTKSKKSKTNTKGKLPGKDKRRSVSCASSLGETQIIILLKTVTNTRSLHLIRHRLHISTPQVTI